MWELIVTVYLTTGTATLIDRQPPRPPVSRAACDEGITAVLTAPQPSGVRVVAYCSPVGGVK